MTKFSGFVSTVVSINVAIVTFNVNVCKNLRPKKLVETFIQK